MSSSILRVHPAIGLARVGNSEQHYLGPETIAALPQPGREETGGLPIRPGTESTTIRSSELRDGEGRFKRQGARFRVYAYPADQAAAWPAQGGVEVVIGAKVDGRTVKDLVWTVHIANKKAAWFVSPDDYGIRAYEQPELLGLTLRNLAEGHDPANTQRLRRLVIDPGPRAVHGRSAAPVHFNQKTEACVGDGAGVRALPAYPRSFPADHFPAPMRYEPQGAIDTLGAVHTDDKGRLVVLGGYGRAVGWADFRVPNQPTVVKITDAVNNDHFFDDTADGPVTCTVVFEDGGTAEVAGAWVVVTDPAYAPQTLNVVSLWDEVYDTFVRQLDLEPSLYRNGAYDDGYRPSFAEQIAPVFKATESQMWNVALPPFAIRAHEAVGRIRPQDNPDDTLLAGLAFVRNPNNSAEAGVGAPLMPLALGDAGKAFLSPSFTQYFFLSQWSKGRFDRQEAGPWLGAGEALDRAILANCLGGRFSPGIDMTFIVRCPELYDTRWRRTGAGPFRIHRKPLSYQGLRPEAPYLGFGWVPATPVAQDGLEPGDVSKFMALPWHADYNSCAIHPTAPNPLGSATLYWSWPAQRPVTVYVAEDVVNGKLGKPRYSVRGPGTMPLMSTVGDAADLANAGRFWDYNDMLTGWQDIGVIMQATNIDDGRGAHYRPNQYLEVQSRLGPNPPELAAPQAWPLIAGPGTARAK